MLASLEVRVEMLEIVAVDELTSAIMAAIVAAYPDLPPPEQIAAIRERYGATWDEVISAGDAAAALFEARQ